MTVSYSKLVATAKFSCFLKLLFRWRGSIYKLLWKDFAVFATLFYFLSFIYRFALTGIAKKMFVKVALYCQQFNSLIPVAFVLGFYVSIVVSRWWEQFRAIPYPSRMALFVSTLVMGSDERARLMRRTIMRYLCLTHVMTMSSISPPVKKRFPTLDNMQEAGFLLPNEQKVLEEMSTTYNKYFVPLIWAAAIVTRARKEGRIKDDFAVKTLIDEINEFRGKCGSLFGYDWVTIPLVYTQVVTLAVYMFFVSCLMGRQFLEEGEGQWGDLYFPFFTFLQFFFYMGWLKVAETLLNPFGEDDDDFDINGLIDKNLKLSYLVVDEMHDHHPELLKDQYWDSLNFEVPYTEASQAYQKAEYVGSAVTIEVPEGKAQLVATSMTTIAEAGNENDDVCLSSDEDQSNHRHARRGSNKRMDLPRVTRQISKLSAFLKPGSRRPSNRPTEGDIESGSASQAMPMLGIKPSTPGNGSRKKLSQSPPFIDDPLQFQMSEDEQSMKSGTSPTSSNSKLPFVQIISDGPPLAVKVIPCTFARQDSEMSTTSSVFKPGSLPSEVHETDHHHMGVGPHHAQSQSGGLAPVVEGPESTDEFAGQLCEQLKAMRGAETLTTHKSH